MKRTAMKRKRKARFRVGQVVCEFKYSSLFYEVLGKRWSKEVANWFYRVNAENSNPELSEDILRPLTARERGKGGR